MANSFQLGDSVVIQAQVNAAAFPYAPVAPASATVRIYDPYNNPITLTDAGAMTANGPLGSYIFIFQTAPTFMPGTWTFYVDTVNTDVSSTQNVSLQDSFILGR